MTTVSLIELLEALETRVHVLMKTCPTLLDRVKAALPELNEDDRIDFFRYMAAAILETRATNDIDLIITTAIVTGIETGRELERRAK